MPDIRSPGGVPRRGTPNTVTKVLPCTTVFVEYNDETGRTHEALAIVLPDNTSPRIWTSPQSEALLRTYQPFGGPLEKQILAQLREREEAEEKKSSVAPDLSEKLEVPL